jgi:hypothetical protein
LFLTTKLLVYEFGAIDLIWSDERAIVVTLVPPDGAKRLISESCSNERYDLPEPKPTSISILVPDSTISNNVPGVLYQKFNQSPLGSTLFLFNVIDLNVE